MSETVQTNQHGHKAWIDALKGIAICGVLLIHAGGNGLPGFAGQVANIGFQSIPLLIVISAYLTFVSLERYYEKGQGTGKTPSYVHWWLKKFVSLIPIYYLAIFFYMLILREGDLYWLASKGRISFTNMLAHLLLLHGLNPYYCDSVLGIEWYLGDLALFYLLAPFLYKKITNLEKAVCFFLITTLGANCINYAAYSLMPQTDVYVYESYIGYFWIFTQLPVFAAGILLYFFLRRMNDMESCRNRRVLSYCILLFCVCMLMGETFEKNQIMGVSKYALASVWFLGVIISQIIHSCHVIVNPFFAELGKNSYAIYLFHYLLLKLYNKYVPIHIQNAYLDWFVRFSVIMLLSYVLSLFLERFFNKPVGRFLAKYILQR